MIYTLTLNPAIDRELTVEQISFDRVLFATGARVDLGGKGFNVSRMLNSFGQASVALAFVGGNTGHRLKEGIRALGIDTDFVWIDGETRTNISIVTPTHEHHIKVNEQGPEVRPSKQSELLDKIRGLARSGDWWVLAGSLPPGMDGSYYAEIINLLNERGAVAILDTTGEALGPGCRENVFLVKPNAEEAQTLTGLPVRTPDQAAAAAAEIRRMGAENVVISLGKQGAVLQTVDRTWVAHPPSVEERNPTGAGDSMVGGVVWALAQNLPLEEALCWGIASGAAAASLSGTDVGTWKRITDLRKQVRLERLEATG